MMDFYKSEKVLFDAVNEILAGASGSGSADREASNEKAKDSDGKAKDLLVKIKK